MVLTNNNFKKDRDKNLFSNFNLLRLFDGNCLGETKESQGNLLAMKLCTNLVTQMIFEKNTEIVT